MNNIIRKEIIILLFCLLIGFALRFYTFGQKSFWFDEIHTFNDSRDNLKGQIKFYKENPVFLHPPLFYILTHQFYPFTIPERDLRIIPLIFGTLSIPMIYFLSRAFSPHIALPCTISLTVMAYHISLSQDARSYTLLMFLGMAGLYFLMKHFKTSKNKYLIVVGLIYAIALITGYSSIPFIIFSQLLWFYGHQREGEKFSLSSFFSLTGLTLLFSLPWIIFVAFNYKGQSINNPFHTEDTGPVWDMFYGIVHDWVPHLPLMVASFLLLAFFPLFSKRRRNAIILLAMFVLPIAGLYLFCRIFSITHFVTSRYFVSFLPLFLITLYLSLEAIEVRFERLNKFFRLRFLFVILFIASNFVILPLYYRSEKQDMRALVTYLKGQLRNGDKIFVETTGYMPGILHYFRIYPPGRHHVAPFRRVSENEVEHQISFIYQNKTITLYHSNVCCTQYVADGSRLWIVVGKWVAQKIKEESPSVLKGYFDGSFLNFTRFPVDASIYLFLWDPKSPDEKGIDLPIE